MISIITPCSRPENLKYIAKSIDFSKIDKWYVMYDTSKGQTYSKQFLDNPKVEEHFVSDDLPQETKRWGHHQRNIAIDLIKDGYIYMLDDDNLLHPDFLNSLDFKAPPCFYTFGRFHMGNRGTLTPNLTGDIVNIGKIDTAMFCVHKSLIGDLKWKIDRVEADGIFAVKFMIKHPTKHVFVPERIAFYNFLSSAQTLRCISSEVVLKLVVQCELDLPIGLLRCK